MALCGSSSSSSVGESLPLSPAECNETIKAGREDSGADGWETEAKLQAQRKKATLMTVGSAQFGGHWAPIPRSRDPSPFSCVVDN